MIEADVLDDCLHELPHITPRPSAGWMQSMADNIKAMNARMAGPLHQNVNYSNGAWLFSRE